MRCSIATIVVARDEVGRRQGKENFHDAPDNDEANRRPDDRNGRSSARCREQHRRNGRLGPSCCDLDGCVAGLPAGEIACFGERYPVGSPLTTTVL